MNVSLSSKDGVAVVSISGLTITYTDLEKLQGELYGIIDGDTSRMVVDLSTVSTMDSFGVGVLMSAFRRLSKKGGVMKLAAVTPRVRSALAITKVDSVIEIHDSVDAACASFGGA